ncbi:MAG: hypothetical protein GC149_00575 [Gammaproteobacteria bacterium]|nr:hypothetical protein [Gammaproteobacteria bacterium]
MLSNGFYKPLHLRRKFSRLLAAFLILLHALALLALLQSLAMPEGIHAGLYGFLLLSTVYHTKHLWSLRDTGAYWVWQSAGTWQRTDEEKTYRVVIARSVQTPWFVSLTLTAGSGNRHSLLIVRDQLHADTFRRLRVRLKLYQEDDAAAAGEDAV